MTEKATAANLTTDQTEVNPNSGPPSQLEQDANHLNPSSMPSEQCLPSSTTAINHVEASSLLTLDSEAKDSKHIEASKPAANPVNVFCFSFSGCKNIFF